VILVGTKIDAVKDDKVTRGVEVDVAKKLAEKIEASCYYETSSKTGENIDNLFNDIVKNIVKLGGGESEKKQESVTIKDSKDTQTPASGSCC
jgi:GTPase Era involved in 16S rRNA processing